MRTIPPLATVCEQESLPVPKALATGEVRMVTNRGLRNFLSKIHIIQQVAYNRHSKAKDAPDAAKGGKVSSS